MRAIRTIHRSDHHLGWDRSIPPVHRVTPGDTLRLELFDASRGCITRDADSDRVRALAPENANPRTGPVQVDGALLSAGDGHLAQGHGEVYGTAADLAVAKLVNAPRWTLAYSLPTEIFT